MALHKAGIDATVDEAYPVVAEPVGAFLTVASNGNDALPVMTPTSPFWPRRVPSPTHDPA